MDFKQLEAFAYVVKHKSFSKAAEKLYLTQPTVSAHVSSLERELEVQLIVRTPKEVYPTETGKVLYDYALSMLSLRENAIARCRRMKEEIKGTIFIAASTITYQYVLPKAMSLFLKEHPQVNFEIKSCDSQAVASSIVLGEAEIGLAGAKMDETNCTYIDFMDDRLVVITPVEAPYASIDPKQFSAAALKQYPFIAREPGSGTRRETEAFLRAKGIDPTSLSVVAQMQEPDAIKNAVSQGLGVSVISQLAVADFVKLNLVRAFPLEGKPIIRRLYIAHHKNRPLSPAASAFMHFVLRHYSGRA